MVRRYLSFLSHCPFQEPPGLEAKIRGRARNSNCLHSNLLLINCCQQTRLLGHPPWLQAICLQCRRHWRCSFDPSVRKTPWRRKWQPTPVFLPEKFHGQRSLESYSPKVAKSQTKLRMHTNKQKIRLLTSPSLSFLLCKSGLMKIKASTKDGCHEDMGANPYTGGIPDLSTAVLAPAEPICLFLPSPLPAENTEVARWGQVGC